MFIALDSPNQSASADRRVAFHVRAGWGAGGITDNFISSISFALGMIINVTAFKMPAGLADLAIAIPRIVNAITDPIIGNFSDNLRTKLGRRRPMIAVCAIGSAILLSLMWLLPMLETAQNPWHSKAPFWYLAISGSVYLISYTLFMVPYTALSFELTDDYDERTRVLAWLMYLGLAASMTVPALYYFCRLPVYGEGVAVEILGIRWASLILTVVVLITVLVTCERPEALIQPTTPIIPAIEQTLHNGSFIVLFITHIAAIVGLFTDETLGIFALIYYVFQESEPVDHAKDHVSILGMFAGILAAVTAYLSMYIAARICRLAGKRIAMTLDLLFMNELPTGLRREGMFIAVQGSSRKIVFAFTVLVGGYLLQWLGFDPETADKTALYGTQEPVVC